MCPSLSIIVRVLTTFSVSRFILIWLVWLYKIGGDVDGVGKIVSKSSKLTESCNFNGLTEWPGGSVHSPSPRATKFFLFIKDWN